MKIIIEENFDFLGDSKEDLEKIFGTEKIDSLFDCLGGSYLNNDDLRKVDKTYAIYCAEICEKLNINHFSIISTNKASPDSSSVYNRIKGEADEEILKKNIKYIDIYRPGVILGRPNAGCLEKDRPFPFHPADLFGSSIRLGGFPCRHRWRSHRLLPSLICIPAWRHRDRFQPRLSILRVGHPLLVRPCPENRRQMDGVVL